MRFCCFSSRREGEDIGTHKKTVEKEIRRGLRELGFTETASGYTAYQHSVALGWRAEERVLGALEIAVKANLLRDVRRTPLFGEKDRRGVDIFFTDRRGRTYCLQVKSSEARAEEFRRHTPLIPVIVVGAGESQGKIIRKLEQLFTSLKGLSVHYRRQREKRAKDS